MPELPEIETTRRGISPHVEGCRITGILVRERRLRWPISRDLETLAAGQPILAVERRGKYLILRLPHGALILHLGMSGSLRLVSIATPPAPHDHLDILLETGICLRLRDPRRFGAVIGTDTEPLDHPLLSQLGPEPLGNAFGGNLLHRLSRKRKRSIKSFLMDGRIVAGIGNIYACESLHLAGIHPQRAAGRISRTRYHRLAAAIRDTLEQAIHAGGTTLQDFRGSDGRPGYFKQALRVYGRAGLPCPRCGAPVRTQRQEQRTTFYCSGCQT